jgi:hypothetical protein
MSIYLFILENEIQKILIYFFKISTIQEQLCAKKNMSSCTCNSNPMVGTRNKFSQVESSIFNVFDKYQ